MLVPSALTYQLVLSARFSMASERTRKKKWKLSKEMDQSNREFIETNSDEKPNLALLAEGWKYPNKDRFV
jgi:hypothetical protein